MEEVDLNFPLQTDFIYYCIKHLWPDQREVLLVIFELGVSSLSFLNKNHWDSQTANRKKKKKKTIQLIAFLKKNCAG